MRPIFEWEMGADPEDFVRRMSEIVSFDPAVELRHASRHAVLSIPEEARHTWSPTLEIQVERRGESTHVHARLGPEPPVWTFFVFLYAASSALGILGSMLGIAQLNVVDTTPWGLAALPGAALVWAGLYVASFVGKGIGADQIHQLLAVVDACLDVDARAVGRTAQG